MAAAVAAYPLALPRFAAPYAPLELGGFAVAITAYLRARQHPLTPRVLAAAAVLAFTLLLPAAVLETLAAGQL